jgi:hypothetical protein
VSAAGVYESGALYVIDMVIGKADEINYPPTEDIEITNPPSEPMIPNHTYRLNATILPTNTFFDNCYWTSSNPEIVEITSPVTAQRYCEIRALSAGTAIITATTYDHLQSYQVAIKVQKRGNRMVNPGFETGPSGGNENLNSNDIPGWGSLGAGWFTDIYGAEAGDNHNNSTRVTAAIGNSWTGNGAQFTQDQTHVTPAYRFLVGSAICRVGTGGNSTGGWFQSVFVTPGETYRFGGRTAARGNETNMKLDGTLRITSADGRRHQYHVQPLDYEKGDGSRDYTMVNTSGTTYVTWFVAEGQWTAPEGVTEVRFQYDQRNYGNTPIVCWDETFFECIDEED